MKCLLYPSLYPLSLFRNPTNFWNSCCVNVVCCSSPAAPFGCSQLPALCLRSQRLQTAIPSFPFPSSVHPAAPFDTASSSSKHCKYPAAHRLFEQSTSTDPMSSSSSPLPRILIPGGAGYIGSHVVLCVLLTRRYRVTGKSS